MWIPHTQTHTHKGGEDEKKWKQRPKSYARRICFAEVGGEKGPQCNAGLDLSEKDSGWVDGWMIT